MRALLEDTLAAGGGARCAGGGEGGGHRRADAAVGEEPRGGHGAEGGGGAAWYGCRGCRDEGRGADQYGQRYVLDFDMTGAAGSAAVRSAWIVLANEDVLRFVSCYVLQEHS
jgi:hypothetical protein